MPLRAQKDGFNIYAFNYNDSSWEELKNQSKQEPLQMPCCDARAIPKTSKLGNFFFDTSDLRQMLMKKRVESVNQVVQGSLKDSYSPTGKLNVMLHNDGDIGIVMTKGDTAEDLQHVDITLATGAIEGHKFSNEVVHALISLIAATQENEAEGVR